MAVYGFKIDLEGDALKKFQELYPQAEKFKLKIDETHSSVGKLGEKIKGLGISMKDLAVGGMGLGALLSIGEFAKNSLEYFDKYEEGVSKLEAVLKSTGSVAGKSIDELKESAKELSGQTLFSQNTIMDAQSMLLTFTSIRGKIYDETLPAITDFATRFKMELPEAANMLGKALNDPLKGMTRLQRQGVVFSDQQKETIQHFMETGQVAKAQEVILKELGTEFGGLANAMSKTDAGKLKMAAKALDEMKLGVGKLISEGLVKLSPLVTGLGELFHKTFGHELSKDMEESRGKMNDLFETLKDGNLTLDQRRGIINELNSEYGPYLKGVITDKMTTEDLAQAQSYSNDQLVKKIALQVNEEAIAKVMNAYKKAEEENSQKRTELNKATREFEEGKERFRKMQEKGFSNDTEEEQARQYLTKLEFEAKRRAQYVLQDNKSELKAAKDVMDKALKDLGVTGSLDLKSRSLADIQAEANKILHPGGNGKITPGGGLGQDAINTSLLSGASGGLGESKMIKIDFHSPLMQVNVPGGNGKDIIEKAPLAIEHLVRITNNLSQSQGATF